MTPVPSCAARDREKRGWRRNGIGARRDDHGGGRGDDGRGVQYAAQGGELGQRLIFEIPNLLTNIFSIRA